jgi:signal transduction histidine kinase
MKNTITLGLFLILSLKASGQPITFEDLETKLNADSLEKTLDRNNPDIYLNHLTLLENAWLIKRDNKSGSKMQIISSIVSTAQKNNVKAILEYLKGGINIIKQKPDLAFRHYNTSLQISKNDKDTVGILMNLIQLTDLYMNQTLDVFWNFKQANFFADQAYALAKIYNNKLYELNAIEGLLTIYSHDKTKRSLFKQTLDKQLALIKSNPIYNNHMIIYAKNLARYYYDTGNVQKSYETLKKNLLSENSYSSRFSYCGYLLNTAFMGIRLAKYNEAYQMVMNVLELTMDKEYRLIRQSAFEALRRIAAEKKEFSNALIFTDSVNAIKDLIVKEESLQKLNALEVEFKTKEIEARNTLLNAENKLVKSNNRSILIVVLLGSILLILLGTLLYYIGRKNKQISQQTQEILRLSRVKDQYYTIVAHDLNAPLNSYQGLASTIKYLIKSKQYEKISTISDQIDTMGANLTLILNNLLSWNKSQDMTFEPELKPLSIDNLLETLLPIYLDLAKLRDINISVCIKQKGLFINGDTNTLSVVIRNLLDNALKNCSEPKQMILNLSANSQDQEITLTIGNAINSSQFVNLNQVISYLNNSKGEPFSASSFGLELIKKFSKTNQINIHSEIVDNNFIVSLDFKMA